MSNKLTFCQLHPHLTHCFLRDFGKENIYFQPRSYCETKSIRGSNLLTWFFNISFLRFFPFFYRPPPKVESKPVIKVEKLDLDKLKFVKAIKREFKEMRRKKEPNLKKPFNRILERLSKTKYSKFSSHELKAKWRNMKGIATVHQKKGLLTQLDRAVLGLLNYKNENATYGSVVSSSSDESEASQQESSSESDGEEDKEISEIEGDDDDKM